MLLTLQKYKKLQSPSNIWGILHNYVTNDTIFMYPYGPEHHGLLLYLYTCCEWH